MSLSARGRALVSGYPWLAEDNVVPRGASALPGEEKYDLALYRHPTASARGVLVVKSVLQFVFLDADDLDWYGYKRAVTYGDMSFDPEDNGLHMAHRVARFVYPHDWERGDTNRPTDDYRKWVKREGEERCTEAMHAWTSQDKQTFMRAWRRIIHDTWELKHELKTDSTLAGYKTIDVVYDVQTTDSWGTVSDHFEINAIHVGGNGGGDGPTSAVNRRDGQAYIDNRDVFMRERIPQVGSAHEYGHMQGLPDEYGPSVQHWLSDRPSIMHGGMEVRPRHYTPLAEWVSRKTREQFEDYSSVADQLDGVVYYVADGERRWTTENAGIYRGRR